MRGGEPAVSISFAALAALLVAAAAFVFVRSRKKNKWKPSKAEERLLRGLDAYTVHTDEGAELLPEKWDNWFDSKRSHKEPLSDRDQPRPQERDPL